MNKLKNINFKALMIDHGEKFVFGLFLLITLFFLYGTRWSKFEGTPEDMMSKAKTAKDKIDGGQFPAEKAAEYSLVSYLANAQKLSQPLNIGAYELSSPLYHPLYRKQELAKEPEWLAVTELYATAGVAVLGVSIKPTALETEGDPENPALSDPLLDDGGDEFSSRQAGTTGAGGAGFPPGGPGFAPGGPPGFGPPGGGIGARIANAPNPGAPPTFAGDSAAMGPYGAMGSFGPMGPGSFSQVKPRGVRFVAVRGVFPLSQQRDRIQRALNLRTPQEAEEYLTLLDFHLERQIAQAGENPWSGKWEKVNREIALEILEECDFDPLDVVDPQITDAAITMPLPLRLSGYWGNHATHPRVKTFELSKEELERELKVQAKFVEQFEKMKLDMQPAVQKKGFSRVTRDFRQMGAMMNAGPDSDDYFREMATSINNDNSGQAKLGVMDLKKKFSAAGRAYLFRYLDFDVEPGRAYRYRVKIELQNPNFERSLEQLVDPALAQGATRETPFSNVSNPAVVEESIHSYLRTVERDPVKDMLKTSRKPYAFLQVFQWDPKVGTHLADLVKLTSVGQFVAEKKETMRLDVSVPSFKKEEQVLETSDVFVDASGDVELGIDEKSPHLAELGLEASKRGRLGLTEDVVVIGADGQLRLLDTKSDTKAEKDLQKRVDAERRDYKDLENKPDAPAGFDPLIGGGPSAGMPGGPAGMMAYMAAMRGSAGNTRKKGGKAGPATSPFPGQGMAFPGGPPAGPGGPPGKSGGKSKAK